MSRIEEPSAGMLGAAVCGAVYLAFAVAVTAGGLHGPQHAGDRGDRPRRAVPASDRRHVPGDSHLAAEHPGDRPADLLRGTQHLPHYLPAFTTAIAASGAALAIAVLRLRGREI